MIANHPCTCHVPCTCGSQAATIASLKAALEELEADRGEAEMALDWITSSRDDWKARCIESEAERSSLAIHVDLADAKIKRHEATISRLREGLERIADEDWRGNKPAHITQAASLLYEEEA